MGHKEITNRALRDHKPDAVIGLELATELIEFLRQNFIERIYRPVIDADECHLKTRDPKAAAPLVEFGAEDMRALEILQNKVIELTSGSVASGDATVPDGRFALPFHLARHTAHSTG